MNMNLGKLWEVVRDREVWHAAVQGGLEKLDTTWQLNNNMTQLLLDPCKDIPSRSWECP